MYFGPQLAKTRNGPNGVLIIWRTGRPSGWALPRILVHFVLPVLWRFLLQKFFFCFCFYTLLLQGHANTDLFNRNWSTALYQLHSTPPSSWRQTTTNALTNHSAGFPPIKVLSAEKNQPIKFVGRFWSNDKNPSIFDVPTDDFCRLMSSAEWISRFLSFVWPLLK